MERDRGRVAAVADTIDACRSSAVQRSISWPGAPAMPCRTESGDIDRILDREAIGAAGRNGAGRHSTSLSAAQATDKADCGRHVANRRSISGDRGARLETAEAFSSGGDRCVDGGDIAGSAGRSTRWRFRGRRDHRGSSSPAVRLPSRRPAGQVRARASAGSCWARSSSSCRCRLISICSVCSRSAGRP